MPVDPRRVQSIFLAAVDHEAAADRAAVLDRECGGDADLRHRVEALLRAHDEPDSLLDRPLVAPRGPATEPGDPATPVSQEIGQGGMGAVFLAESRSGLVLELAQEFLGRHRRGERPALKEYIARYPALAGEIREVFPAMAMREKIALADESLAGPAPARTAAKRRPRADRLGDFRILREIGRGGMGVVYEAEQVSLGRHVALKVLPESMARDARHRPRFEREAKAAARLHHTNIVPVFGVGEHGGTPYYVMQFIPGTGLDEVIDELVRLQILGRKPTVGYPAGLDGPGPATTEDPEPSAASTAAGPRDRPITLVAESLLNGRLRTEGMGVSSGGSPDATGSATPGPAATDRFDPEATSDRPGPVTGRDGPELRPASAPSGSAALPGGTQISEVDRSGRRLPFFRAAAQIARQAAQGLAYAHARGVVHRDIKPSNLLLDTAGVAWITDFGLAKAEDDGLTATGDILGTLRYMAPERFRGEGDARADIYALGLTLYELLTLHPAFDASDRLKLIERVKSEEPPRPRSIDGRIPRDLETIVIKAIDKEPAGRYPTADAMAEDLRRFLDDAPILARRASIAERYARWARHHPGIAVLGAVLTAVLILATLGSLVAASRFRKQAHRQSVIAGEREDERQRAEARRVEAEAARLDAEAARRHAETVVVDMHVARGLVAAERDEPAAAMLWFAKAADLARHDPDRERLNRIRVKTWEREAVVPVHTFEHPGQVLAGLAFRPGGGGVLTVTSAGKSHLWSLDDGSELRSPGGDRPAASAAWSPDGTSLALGFADGGIVFQRADDGSKTLEVDTEGRVRTLAFSPDGTRLAAGLATGARFWDTATGEPIGPPLPHPQAVDHVQFSPRGDGLLTFGPDAIARVYDVPPTTDRPRFEYGPAPMGTSPRFSADGAAILCVSGLRQLSWLDAGSGRSTGPGRIDLDLRRPEAIAVSPDGQWFAAGGIYGPQLFPVDPAAGPPRLFAHKNQVTTCAFSSDSTLLASGGWDRTARLWSTGDGAPVGAPLPHQQRVIGVAFSPDGRHLATVQDGGLVRLWRLPAGARVALVDEAAGANKTLVPVQLRRSGDGRRAIASRWYNPWYFGSLSGRPISVYELATARATGVAVRLPGEPFDAVLDSRGRRAAAVTRSPEGGRLHAWDVASGRPLFSPRPLEGRPLCLDISPDDFRIATLGDSGRIQVFDAGDGRLLRSWALDPPWALDLPAAGRFAQLRFNGADTIVVHYQGRFAVWDAEEGRPLLPPVRAGRPGVLTASFALSEDGRLAAIGDAQDLGRSDFSVRIWDLVAGSAVSPALSHPDVPIRLAFTPDGRRLLTAGRDGQLRCWDWKAGTLAAPPCTADDEFTDVIVLPGGRYAATSLRCSNRPGGNLEVWDLASGKRAIPALKLGDGSLESLALSADGRRALAADEYRILYEIDLSDLIDPDPRPTAELVRLGELASGQRIVDGDLVGLSAEEWLARWREAPHRFFEAPAPFAR